MNRDEYRALGKRLLRPERPRLAEARAAVEGVTDAREAWETLVARGFVPDDEVDVSYRKYRRGRGQWAPSPATARDAAVVAADFAAMLTAEELAREFLAAAKAVGVVASERFLWETGWPRSRAAGASVHDALDAAGDAALDAAGDDRMERAGKSVWPMVRAAGFPYEFEDLEGQSAGAEFEEFFASHIAATAGDAWVWADAAKRGLRLAANAKGVAKSARGELVRDLPDPYEPLLALWGTGYGLDRAGEEGVTLVCPRVMAKKGRNPK